MKTGHRSNLDVSDQWLERTTPMTHHDFDPSELLDGLRERPDLDLVRDLVDLLYQAIIGGVSSERSSTADDEA